MHATRKVLKLGVTRDSQGCLLRTQALCYDYAASARAMEAYAIKDVVRLAAERGYTNAVIESDAKEVVALCHQGDERSDIMAICQEIGDTMRVFN
jgi:hypothetical protein